MGSGKAASAGQQAAGAQEQIMQQILGVWQKQAAAQRAAVGGALPKPEYMTPGTNLATFGGQNLSGGTPTGLASYAPSSVTNPTGVMGTAGGGNNGTIMTASPIIASPTGPRSLPAPASGGGQGGVQASGPFEQYRPR